MNRQLLGPSSVEKSFPSVPRRSRPPVLSVFLRTRLVNSPTNILLTMRAYCCCGSPSFPH